MRVQSPRWVRTDTAGADAPRSVQQGADTAIWLATLPDDGPHRQIFPRQKADALVGLHELDGKDRVPRTKVNRRVVEAHEKVGQVGGIEQA
jgi:hypothetical protein